MKQSIPLPKEYKREVRDVLETMKMADVLTKDMEKIVEFSENVKYVSDPQFWMRIMVRTAVDSMNTLIYRLETASRNLIKLHGDERKLPRKPKKKNLRYIFKVFAVAIDSTFEIKEDDVRLNDYSEAREIRRRITHPKKLTDLDISLEKEYVKFADTFHWFSDCIKQLNKQSKWTRKYPQVKILY